MPNTLKITVENADELLNAGAYDTGALIQIQSAATEAGAFADLTGTGSTPTIALASGTRIHTGYDPNGTASTWYRTRYKNAAGTRLSDWSAAFQVGPEGAGLICSLYDVKQALGETGTANDESILEHIRRVTSEIQLYTGRRFVRDPLSGTEALSFDVARDSRILWVPAGIAACTQVEVATYTGGSFTVVSSADWFLDPPEQERSYGWPATRVTISDVPTGSVSHFYQGKRTARLTMALGWDTIPYDVQGIGERASVSAYMSKGSGGVNAAIGPSGAMTILRHISPADRATLDIYRVVPV